MSPTILQAGGGSVEFQGRILALTKKAGFQGSKFKMLISSFKTIVHQAMERSSFPSPAEHCSERYAINVARIVWKVQHSIRMNNSDVALIVPSMIDLHVEEVNARERLFRERNSSVVTLPDFSAALLVEYEKMASDIAGSTIEGVTEGLADHISGFTATR
ncbi:hypothetical protein BKA70DRAFT_1432641 [Coprinopsis sp. MPI-PUGE-AT-0042]|nr:hypothetical protein BKA70DRAFT_1432641 [Coprinopsis sp. MPI-PUGE-AT-0042]